MRRFFGGVERSFAITVHNCPCLASIEQTHPNPFALSRGFNGELVKRGDVRVPKVFAWIAAFRGCTTTVTTMHSPLNLRDILASDLRSIWRRDDYWLSTGAVIVVLLAIAHLSCSYGPSSANFLRAIN